MEHGRERHLLQAYHHGTNITLKARVCVRGCPNLRSCRTGSKAWRSSCLRFLRLKVTPGSALNGSCHRADAAEGAGVIVRNLRTRSLPKRPTPFLTARTSTAPRAATCKPSPIIPCTGMSYHWGNSSILSYWRRTARAHARPWSQSCTRRSSLQLRSLRYVPRKANAGASAAAQNKATLPISLPAPAGEMAVYRAIALSKRSSFCLGVPLHIRASGGRVSALMLRGSRSSSRSRTGSMVMIV